MAHKSIMEFRTPVVREMTDDEYREQRRRVIASLVAGTGGAPSEALPPVKS
jgi:hypothetical protein